jgi:hypothetical protein
MRQVFNPRHDRRLPCSPPSHVLDDSRSQLKYSHPTKANAGSSTTPDHPMKAKKLGIAIPRSTAMA